MTVLDSFLGESRTLTYLFLCILVAVVVGLRGLSWAPAVFLAIWLLTTLAFLRRAGIFDAKRDNTGDFGVSLVIFQIACAALLVALVATPWALGESVGKSAAALGGFVGVFAILYDVMSKK